jgi:hypothetical protein
VSPLAVGRVCEPMVGTLLAHGLLPGGLGLVPLPREVRDRLRTATAGDVFVVEHEEFAHVVDYDQGGTATGYTVIELDYNLGDWWFWPRVGRSRGTPPNERMQLTKLRAAPVRRLEVPPCAPAGGTDGGTASLIRGVRRTKRTTGIRAVELVSSPLVNGVERRLGWSAMPRTVVWLCVPALLTGMAGATILSGAAVLPAEQALRRVILQAAAAEAVVFALPSLALTPIAGILTFAITRQKKWSSEVVWTLWVIVVVSLVIIVPSTNLAMANFVYSTPRPAEAPLVRK